MDLPSYGELSKEQDHVYNLPLADRVFVTGAPGTGKTVMALYRARAMQERGIVPHLLMFNRALSQYIGDNVENLGLDGKVSTFHSFISSWWRRCYGGRVPQLGPYQFDWNAIIERLAVDPPTAPSPTLIVDEAQDLPREAHSALWMITGGRLNVFADENQRITESNSTLADIKGVLKPHHHATLSLNYRNTRQVAEFAAKFHRDAETGIAALADPNQEGDTPLLRRFPSLNDEVQAIVEWAKTYSDETLGVLVPTKRVQTQLFNRLKGKFRRGLVQQYIGGEGAETLPLHWGRPGVKLLCWASAKGLQFDTVWLPQLNSVSSRQLESTELFSTLYVMATRASYQLMLSYVGAPADCPILRHLPGHDFLERDE